MSKLLLIALLSIPVGAQELPEAPRPSRSFWTLAAVDLAATAGDMATTVALVGHTRGCPFEVGNPALYGSKPAAARTIAVMGAITSGAILTSYEMRRHNAHLWRLKLWALPMAYDAYGHTWGTINNLTVCR